MSTKRHITQTQTALRKRIASWFVLCLSGLSPLLGQAAFTFQGRLTDGANAANGRYDLRFGLWDSVSTGNQIGAFFTLAPVPVSNGVFTVNLDFGAAPFSGAARWLEISVRTNGSAQAYTTLSPR